MFRIIATAMACLIFQNALAMVADVPETLRPPAVPFYKHEKVEEDLRRQGYPIKDAGPEDPEYYGDPPKSMIFAFSFKNPLVAPHRIIDAGTMPGGIPTITRPQHVDAATITPSMIADDEYVVVAGFGEDVVAYPVSIMNWHMGVNDTIGGIPVFVSWDPISGAASAWKRQINGDLLEFGVSGMVYQSSTVYYDRKTQSLWNPLFFGAITGHYSGTQFEQVPTYVTYWKEFYQKYPRGKVLSSRTGYHRDYKVSPYGDYGRQKRLIFPVAYHNDTLPRKEPVIGVRLRMGKDREVTAAFPMNKLLQWPPGRLDFAFGPKRDMIVTLEYSEPAGRFIFSVPPEVDLKVINSYWFAWSAFYPNTLVIQDLP